MIEGDPESRNSYTLRDLYLDYPGFFLFTTIVFSVLCFAAYMATSKSYVNHDCFIIGEAAQHVVQGEPLYESAWENKPPIGILCYAIPQLINLTSYACMQAFLGGVLILQSLMILVLLRDQDALSVITGSVFVALLPFTDVEFTWASTEHWQNLFVTPSILLLLRFSRSGIAAPLEILVSGMLLAIAVNCRQSTAPLFLLHVVVVMCSSGPIQARLGTLGLGVVGALVGEGLVLALAASTGSVSNYVDSFFLAPIRYLGTGDGGLASTAYFFVATARTHVLTLIAFLILATTWKSRDRLFIYLLFAISCMMVVSPAKPYWHYMAQMLPAIAIGTQSMISALAMRATELRRPLVTSMLAVLCLNGGVSIVSLTMGSRVHHMNDLQFVADHIQENALEQDTLFCVGEHSAYLYYATDVSTAHPIFWDMFFGRLSATIPYPIDEVERAYLEHPPTLLAIHDKVLEVSIGHEAIPKVMAPNARSVALCQMLMNANDYEVISQPPGWKVLRWRDHHTHTPQ